MTDKQPDNRAVHEDGRLQALRDEWIAAKNASTDAWTAFMEANKHSPLRRELNAAEATEKAAYSRYRDAWQNPMKEQT